MRTIAFFGMGLGLVVSGAAMAISPDPSGNWARSDGQTHISIKPCGDKFCATNIWVKDPSGDEKLGDTLIMTLQPESATVLKGEAYDQRRKMTFSMEIDVNNMQIETHGCMLIGLACKTAEWSHIQ